jgi:hypothetical protein
MPKHDQSEKRILINRTNLFRRRVRTPSSLKSSAYVHLSQLRSLDQLVVLRDFDEGEMNKPLSGLKTRTGVG